MSSTNRRKSGVRDPFDYYPTPEWCIHRFLEKANIPYTHGGFWLEPAAGDGAILRAVGNFQQVKKNGTTTVIQYKPTWIAVEIQPRFQANLEAEIDKTHVLITDFLSLETDAFGASPQVVIANPPFSLALDFIKRAMDFKADYICMLLRLNFLGSSERSEFMRQHTPDIYVLPNRPSFTGKGTDSIEYAWFVWRSENGYGAPGHKAPDTLKCPSCLKPFKSHTPKVVMLDDTTAEARRTSANSKKE